MRNIGTQVLLTENLYLRCFKQSDAESLFLNCTNDEENCNQMSWKYHALIDETKEQLNEWINNYKFEDFYLWAITRKDDINEVIGLVKLYNSDTKAKTIDANFMLSRKYRKLGYMSETMRMIFAYAFNQIGAERIYGNVLPDNFKAQKLYLKFGFKYVNNNDYVLYENGVKTTYKRYELVK